MNAHQFFVKKRQLKALILRLQYLIENKISVTDGQIERLIQSIKALVRQLSAYLSPKELKKILGTVAILAGISVGNQLSAQSFEPPVLNPFNLDSVNYIAFPAFADLDADGDLDLIVGEYYGFFQYFQNIGSPETPKFSHPNQNPFGLVSTNYFASPTLADIDDDGDFDLLAGESYGNLVFFENTGTANSPAFAPPQFNPFGLVQLYEIAFPAFADLDADGDMDILCGEYYGAMKYFENTGTKTTPQFGDPQVNPFGLDTTYYLAFPSVADLDDDGDLDVLVGEYYGFMKYFENIGSPTNPDFDTPQLNPFGLVPTNYWAMPAFADLDDDGDLDLLVGEYDGVMQYFENSAIVGIDSKAEIHNIKVYPNPVSNFLRIESDQEFNTIEVFDLYSKRIFIAEDQSKAINTSSWKPGLYIIKFTDSRGTTFTKKIQKI